MIGGAGRRALAAVVGEGVTPRVAAQCVPREPTAALPALQRVTQRRRAHVGIGVDEEYGIPTVGLRECIAGSGIVARMAAALRGPGYFVETRVLGDAVSLAMREDAVRLCVWCKQGLKCSDLCTRMPPKRGATWTIWRPSPAMSHCVALCRTMSHHVASDSRRMICSSPPSHPTCGAWTAPVISVPSGRQPRQFCPNRPT